MTVQGGTALSGMFGTEKALLLSGICYTLLPLCVCMWVSMGMCLHLNVCVCVWVCVRDWVCKYVHLCMWASVVCIQGMRGGMEPEQSWSLPTELVTL